MSLDWKFTDMVGRCDFKHCKWEVSLWEYTGNGCLQIYLALLRRGRLQKIDHGWEGHIVADLALEISNSTGKSNCTTSRPEFCVTATKMCLLYSAVDALDTKGQHFNHTFSLQKCGINTQPRYKGPKI